MKLSADARDLSTIVATVAAAACKPQHCTLPVLPTVRLEATDDGRILLEATDLDVWCQATLPVTVHTAGVARVDAVALAKLVKGRGAVDIVATPDAVTVTTAAGAATLPFVTADRPAWPEAAGVTVTLPVAALRSVLPAVDTDAAVPILSSVHLSGRRVQATDKYRLHAVDVAGLPADTMPDVLVPGRVVAMVCKYAAKIGARYARVRFGVQHVALSVGDVMTWHARTVPGRFPDTAALLPGHPAQLPDAPTITFADPAGAAATIAGMAKTIGRRSTASVKVEATAGPVLRLHVTRDDGMALEAITPGHALHATAWTPAYLAAFLEGAGHGELSQRRETDRAALVWTDAVGEHTRLLMPVRV